MYGVEESPIPAPQPGRDDDIVEVVSPRNKEDYEQLLQEVDPYEDDEKHGISLYAQVLAFVRSHT